jgi:PhzF family phenazine biosynthesis protein
MKRLHRVFGLKPDTSALSAFLDARRLTGLCAFTTETIDRRSHVHSRFFAPNVGIPEDPVTGSSNGPLGVYLAKYTDVASGRSDVTLIGEQGDEIGRRGRVTIRVTLKGSEPTGVSIGGRAVTVMNSEMIISGH